MPVAKERSRLINRFRSSCRGRIGWDVTMTCTINSYAPCRGRCTKLSACSRP